MTTPEAITVAAITITVVIGIGVTTIGPYLARTARALEAAHRDLAKALRKDIR